MAKHLILVVDDDVPILRLVRAKLQADGYSVMTAGNGEDALSALEEERPDLVVLDLMMPGMDGFETMRRIREDSTIPIILLTARTGASDKIQGLDLGADDYVTKPFNPDELSSRIAAVLRRTTGGARPKNQVLRYDHLTINLEKRRVTVDGEEVHLSRTEWELLHQLASHTGRVMLHAELLTRIWGPEFRDETHYLRTWVSRLRKKLGDDQEPPTLITTFPGMGYRLEPPEEAG
ncbi:response regulator transcription factor [Nitrolancea hollandica]|uniref:Putative transcriptional regulator ycf27 n=1 Tax=Nitrolancea hollandica Lb TaxID=1129897 RepID=I4EKR3_9BACT|nr:response regulator transcription factor [Nitrolancea hollandica]CCF85275.1 putative transcriptional regulator ycf27 [Nitrolancea hollandica Lb]